MRSALCSMRTVHERIIFLAIRIAVRHCHFNIVSFQVDDGIKNFFADVFFQQIAQAIFGIVFNSVEINAQSRIKENIVPEQALNIFVQKMIVAENRSIGLKLYQCSFAQITGFYFTFFYQFAFGKFGIFCFVFANALHIKVA